MNSRRIAILEEKVRKLTHITGTLVSWLYPNVLGGNDVKHLLEKIDEITDKKEIKKRV